MTDPVYLKENIKRFHIHIQKELETMQPTLRQLHRLRVPEKTNRQTAPLRRRVRSVNLAAENLLHELELLQEAIDKLSE